MASSAEIIHQQLLETFSDQEIATLMALLKRVRIDPVNGDLTIHNEAGNAYLTLRANGTLRAEGVRVVAKADETLILDAAIIGLN